VVSSLETCQQCNGTVYVVSSLETWKLNVNKQTFHWRQLHAAGCVQSSSDTGHVGGSHAVQSQRGTASAAQRSTYHTTVLLANLAPHPSSVSAWYRFSSSTIYIPHNSLTSKPRPTPQFSLSVVPLQQLNDLHTTTHTVVLVANLAPHLSSVLCWRILFQLINTIVLYKHCPVHRPVTDQQISTPLIYWVLHHKDQLLIKTVQTQNWTMTEWLLSLT